MPYTQAPVVGLRIAWGEQDGAATVSNAFRGPRAKGDATRPPRFVQSAPRGSRGGK
jgi:hypothetical protein